MAGTASQSSELAALAEAALTDAVGWYRYTRGGPSTQASVSQSTRDAQILPLAQQYLGAFTRTYGLDEQPALRAFIDALGHHISQPPGAPTIAYIDILRRPLMLAVSHDDGERRAYLGVVQRHGETIADAEQAQLQEYVRAAVHRLLGARDGPVPDRLDLLWMQERSPRGWGIRLLDRFDLPGENARAFDLAGCLMRAKYATIELGKFVICCALVADCNKRSGQGHGR